MKTIAVIGAGALGSTVCALGSLLSRSRILPEIRLVLIEREAAAQMGATQAVNVNHESGFEYFRPGHQQTGFDCVHGGLAKRLLLPVERISTGVPGRFFLSADTSEIKFSDFRANVERMRREHQRLFSSIIKANCWSLTEATETLGSGPAHFGMRLPDTEYDGVEHVVGGYLASGSTVDILKEITLKQKVLQDAEDQGVLEVSFCDEVTQIADEGSKLSVRTRKRALIADSVLICAGHGNPAISLRYANRISAPASGMFHLNAMLYLQLAPLKDAVVRKMMGNMNFVLQGESGCMYACLRPPDATESGRAAVYFPSPRGSQLRTHFHDKRGSESTPEEWDHLIAEGLPSRECEERIHTIFEQLYRYNPFLRGAVEVESLVIRSVFNPCSRDNPLGSDRRVRELTEPKRLSARNPIFTLTSPKWTNVELSALGALHHIMRGIGTSGLPLAENGLGPLGIDVAAIARKIRLAV